MKPVSSTSATAARTWRMSDGIAERTSAVTGSAMCTAISSSLRGHDRDPNPTDTMPPGGNHPLRTPRSNRPKASARSGITSSAAVADVMTWSGVRPNRSARSEEHTSELQSRLHLVCRLLLEKKKKKKRHVKSYACVHTARDPTSLPYDDT